MSKYLIMALTLFFNLTWGFEPIPITPYPVIGYQESSFADNSHGAYRQMLIWYPVDALTVGNKSTSPWDLFL